MTAATAARPILLRLAQIVSLLFVPAVLYATARLVPISNTAAGLASALGLLLLCGVLCSEVLGLIKLPHLTGYIVAGVLAGPHGLRLIDHDSVVELSKVNTLAISLIALAGGLELKMSTLREVRKSLIYSTLIQSSLGLVVSVFAFFALRSYLPFVASLSASAALGVALLWGVLAVSRSPSATLAILSQTKAQGPLTRFSLAFVMSSDIVVVLMMAAAMVFARPLLSPGGVISLSSFGALSAELYGSISVGATLGLLLALYLRFVGAHLVVLLILLGFGFTAAVHYLHLEPLLTFIIAGFIVQNFSTRGDQLLHAIEATGAVVFVVFFAIAGAHLDLPLLLRLWPIALSLVVIRALTSVTGHVISSRLAKDPPVLKTWGWTSLISQAGLTLGLSVMIEKAFPEIGTPFRALVVATVALNEVIGPVLFKLGLDRAGETTEARSALEGASKSEAGEAASHSPA